MLAATTQATAAASDGGGSPAPWLRPLGTRTPLGGYLRDAWRRRDFAIELPLGDLRAQHMDTFLGQVWHLLNPALLVGVYFLVFGVVLKANRGVDHFLAFLTIGIMMFQYTQRSAITGASTITSNEGLLRSIQFPRVLLPASSLVFETAAFAPAVLVMLVVAVSSGVGPELSWLLLAPVLALQIAFNLGIVLIVARLADRFRDVQQVLPFVFRILLYVSGVLFSLDHYVDSELARSVFVLNPLYCLISLGRGAILGTSVEGAMWASAGGWACILLVGGFLFFRSAENRYGRG